MIRIRRYKKSDNDVIWQLHALGLAEIGVQARSGTWDRDLHDIENVYLKNGDFLVGIFESKIVAMGGLKRVGRKTAEIKRMRVHPQLQRRGFGQAIIEELEKRARKMGYKKIILDTSEKWTKAQNFYRKNGYQEVGRETFTERYHAVFYEKEL